MDEGSSSSSTTASTVATTPTTAGSPTMVTGVGSLVNAIARAVQSGMSASMEELGRTIDDKIQAGIRAHTPIGGRGVSRHSSSSSRPPMQGTLQPGVGTYLGAAPATCSIAAPLSTSTTPSSQTTILPVLAASEISSTPRPGSGDRSATGSTLAGGSSLAAGMESYYGSMPPPAAIASVPSFRVEPPQVPLSVPVRAETESVALPLTASPSVFAPPLPTAPQALAPSGVTVPPKLAQKIWRGEFIEMAELLPDKLGMSDAANVINAAREEKKTRSKRVSSILQWVECFHAYIGVVIQQQPDRAHDLLAYASTIVHAARKYKGDGWATYDRNFRKRAAAHPREKWGELNTPLWTLAFCNAEPKEHCNLCFSLDHTTTACEDYEATEEFQSQSRQASRAGRPKDRASLSQRRPICINWNRYSCTSSTCEYLHICLECHQRHHERDCPTARRFSPYPKERPSRKEGAKPPFRGRGPSSQ